MRRTVLLLASVLLAVVALGSDSPKEYDDKTEYVGIEGTWRLTETEYNGGEKEKPRNQEVLILRSGRYIDKYSDSDAFQGNYRIDPAQKPPHLDWCVPSNAPLNGKTVPCIYEIDGDTLRIAILFVKGRPQGFKGESVLVSTYKRVK